MMLSALTLTYFSALSHFYEHFRAAYHHFSCREMTLIRSKMDKNELNSARKMEEVANTYKFEKTYKIGNPDKIDKTDKVDKIVQ